MIEVQATLIDIDVNDNELRTGVLAEMPDVSQKEFFAAAQTGFKSEAMIRVWSFEYSGEPYVEINDKRYKVYRTYTPEGSEKTELYLASKVGVF